MDGRENSTVDSESRNKKRWWTNAMIDRLQMTCTLEYSTIQINKEY